MKLSTRTAHGRMTRICFIDYEREMALVAEDRNADSGEQRILGVTRLSKIHGTDSAEWAIIILDEFQYRSISDAVHVACGSWAGWIDALQQHALEVGKRVHLLISGQISGENAG